MSKTGYIIRVVGERASDIHRSRNMAEEIHVELTQRGLGSTSDPDTMKTEFQIYIDKKQNLSEATKLMKKIINNHFMESDIEIEKL